MYSDYSKHGTQMDKADELSNEAVLFDERGPHDIEKDEKEKQFIHNHNRETEVTFIVENIDGDVDEGIPETSRKRKNSEIETGKSKILKMLHSFKGREFTSNDVLEEFKNQGRFFIRENAAEFDVNNKDNFVVHRGTQNYSNRINTQLIRLWQKKAVSKNTHNNKYFIPFQ